MSAETKTINEMKHLIRVLCKYEQSIQDLLYSEFAENPSESVIDLLMRIPTVQGIKQRMYIKKIAEMPHDPITAYLCLAKIANGEE